MFTGHGGTGKAEAKALGKNVLDVSASIAPFPAPEAALRAFHQAAAELGAYPEIEGRSLRQAVAARAGLASDNVLVGCGSTEFIYLIVRALVPERVISFIPTYRDYADAARLAGRVFVPLLTNLEQQFARDLGRLDASGQPKDMVFLCNPNNPTGHLLPPALIREFSARRPDITVVVDEAYADFIGAEASCLDSALPPNLLILRSPTKFYALPGLRLGYCFGPRGLIEKLLDAKEPWTANAPALAVGGALLSCADHDARVRQHIRRATSELTAMLASIPGLSVCPGAANFLLCRILADAPTSAELRAVCLHRGLLIRDASNFDGLDSHYFRVAVRTDEENIRMAQILREVLSKLWRP